MVDGGDRTQRRLWMRLDGRADGTRGQDSTRSARVEPGLARQFLNQTSTSRDVHHDARGLRYERTGPCQTRSSRPRAALAWVCPARCVVTPGRPPASIPPTLTAAARRRLCHGGSAPHALGGARGIDKVGPEIDTKRIRRARLDFRMASAAVRLGPAAGPSHSTPTSSPRLPEKAQPEAGACLGIPVHNRCVFSESEVESGHLDSSRLVHMLRHSVGQWAGAPVSRCARACGRLGSPPRRTRRSFSWRRRASGWCHLARRFRARLRRRPLEVGAGRIASNHNARVSREQFLTASEHVALSPRTHASATLPPDDNAANADAKHVFSPSGH